ncbi:MAG: hypothetical protein ACFB20_13400 [Opitutales bacterium]
MEVHRPLVMRSNRFLGSALVERNLIEVGDLETANAKLLEIIQSGEMRQASLLNILMYDMQVLEEEALIERILEDTGLGLIELGSYDLTRMDTPSWDIGACWATQTVPYDAIEGFHFVATAYYLSQPARKWWEELLDGEIIWYVAPMASIADCLEQLQEAQASAEAEAEVGATEDE